MMRILAVLLTLLPSLALAGGAPLAVNVSVVVPCYPENVFELCPVPVPDLHRPGYLPRTVPSTARLVVEPQRTYLFPAEERFAIFVTPNLVPYELAIRDAARVAAAHCGRQGGETVLARIDARERYAPEDLESWKFGGTCE